MSSPTGATGMNMGFQGYTSVSQSAIVGIRISAVTQSRFESFHTMESSVPQRVPRALLSANEEASGKRGNRSQLCGSRCWEQVFMMLEFGVAA